MSGSHKPPSFKRICNVMEKVCRGLHHAHSQGIVHRDIKPGNILIDKHEDPHILDFGIIKVTQTTNN